MQLFSQRNGHKPQPMIQIDEISGELKTRVWNVLAKYVFVYRKNASTPYSFLHRSLDYVFFLSLWTDFLKLNINFIKGVQWDTFYSKLYSSYMSLSWDEVYSLIEFCLLKYSRDTSTHLLREELNKILEEENSAYRIFKNQVVPITDTAQLAEVQATQSIKASGVRAHINRAMELLSDRKNPDYRNSVKESISAVEAMARSLTGKDSATLGDLVDIIDDKSQTKLHGAFKEALKKLYGYTSDEKGIRHSLLEQKDISSSDAMFMLVVCSAFVNFCERSLGETV